MTHYKVHYKEAQIISLTIIELMREAGHGVAFKCTLSGDVIRYIGCHFVDDATQVDQHTGNNSII